ncbi:MAG: PTS sugar transporter subunit IIA [Proteobacteria bacterium]|nr:PTS sugar transporter subunit IIA [Pseudomonadota bacterium]
MHLTEILRPDMVWPALTSKTKPEVIGELAEKISEHEKGLDADRIAEILMERERLGSTGIQDGIAIPHGKVPGLEKIVIGFGLSREGIDFEAHDGKPTHIFFVLLAPESAAGQHLKALARLSRLLKDAEFREKLVSAKDSAGIYAAISEEDERY